jgi:hypothetical protein
MTLRPIMPLAWLFAALLLPAWMALPCGAITVGQIDNFQDATAQGWQGASGMFAPTTVADVGPAGGGDYALRVQTNGIAGGSGSRLVTFNEDQWTGNWTAVGVTGIRLDVRNPGATDLYIRLGIAGPMEPGGFGSGDTYVTGALVVPADDAWHALSFDVTAPSFTPVRTGNDIAAALASVAHFRMLHSPTEQFNGATGAATMYLDNIRSVPESNANALCGGALVAVAAAAVIQRRRKRPSGASRSAGFRAPRVNPRSRLRGRLAALAIVCMPTASAAWAQNQTPDVTPIQFSNPLPYTLSLVPLDFGAAELPTLHSYAAAQYDGKWILLAGRTNGLHGFDRFDPVSNFPPQYQNREIWLIDPVSRQSWRRSLDDPSSGLTEAQILSLSPTNNQFTQRGDRLYMTGGYGIQPNGDFGTFDTLTAIDLPGIAQWVAGGAGTAADHIRQLSDPVFRVTGGAMYEIDGRAHLAFGQDFDGPYVPNSNGAYTNQVRSFDMVDDGVTLAVANPTASTPQDAYRRRDLNVFPVLKPLPGGGHDEGLVALSGVFTPGFGVWTVPVEIDASGNPTMADPNDPATFKQGFNGYDSAKLGLYSEAAGTMQEILFGGISMQYIDPVSGQVVTDNQLPFVNDVTAVTIDADGVFSQQYLGEFPELLDANGLSLRFGANAEFFAADGVAVFPNDVIQFDQLSGDTLVGYIMGGITANGPQVRNVSGVTSAASNAVFAVYVHRVPEPSGLVLAMGTVALLVARFSQA